MVGHIIVGVMRDDKIGIGVFDNIHELIPRFFVVVVNFKVVKPCADNLNPCHCPCLFRFICANHAKFIRWNDYVSQITAGNMANNDRITAFYTFC